MPKLTGPMFSLEAHGSLGKAITFQRRPGGASVYGYKKPKVPLTDRQLWQRDLIKWCVYEWKQLTDEQKNDWEDKAKGQGQSGYSYFIKKRRGYLFNPDVDIYLPLYDSRLKSDSFNSFDSYGHLCTVTGATWGSTGRIFPGLNNNVLINYPFNPTNKDFGILTWLYHNRVSPDLDTILTSDKGTTHQAAYYGLDFCIDATPKVLAYFSDGSHQIGCSAALSINTWHHIALIRSSSLWRIYVDLEAGTDGNVSTYSMKYDGAFLTHLGARYNGALLPFSGIIGELEKIKGKAPSLAEITHHRNSTMWGYI